MGNSKISLLILLLVSLSFVSAGDVTIYRCVNPTTGDHMISLSNSCEVSWYNNEGTIGYLKDAETPEATGRLYRCYSSSLGDHFITGSSNCEGNSAYSNDGPLGYFSTNDDGLGAFYRCYNSQTGDHFITGSSNCEGSSYINEGILGYWPKDYVPPCVDSSWSPDSSTVCSGVSFTQTSNCGNTRTGTGIKDCSTPSTPSTPAPTETHGNGIIEGSEQCDDGNLINGDGCSSTETVETGYTCTGQPSVCEVIHGDSIITGGEECDDGNTANSDGCSSIGEVESGWECSGTPSVCEEDTGSTPRSSNSGNSVYKNHRNLFGAFLFEPLAYAEEIKQTTDSYLMIDSSKVKSEADYWKIFWIGFAILIVILIILLIVAFFR